MKNINWADRILLTVTSFVLIGAMLTTLTTFVSAYTANDAAAYFASIGDTSYVTAAGDIIPSTGNVSNLGDTTNRWNNIYSSGNIEATNINLSGNITPNTDITFNLGSLTRWFKNTWTQTITAISGSFSQVTTTTLNATTINGGTGRGATYVIAASDANQTSKNQADVVVTGNADDEIQAAVDNMIVANYGGEIHFSAGTFTLGNSVNLSSVPAGLGIIFSGEGIEETHIYPASGANISLFSSNTTLWFTKWRNIHMKGTVGAVYTATYGIYTVGLADSTIEDCFIEQFSQYCVYLGVAWNDNVRGSIIEYGQVGGLYSDGSDLKIVQNKFLYNAVGIYADTLERSSIVANYFYFNSKESVKLYDVEYVVFSNNIVHGSSHNNANLYASVSVEQTSIYTSILDNIINGDDNSTNGIYVRGTYMNINGNVITNNGQYGIYAQSLISSIIENNVIEGNSQQTNNTYDGILLTTSDDNLVTGNLIRQGVETNKQKNGINIYLSTSDRNIIKNNDLYTSGNTTALLNGGSNTIVGGNKGYTTENSGNFTITAGQWGVSFAHGLATNATSVQFTLTSNCTTTVYAPFSSFTSTNITANLSALQGSDITGTWRATIGAGN